MRNRSQQNALLVEDDLSDRARIRLDLEMMGLVVFETAWENDAQRLLAEREFHVVLIHLGHAPSASIQLCRAIKARSNVPIIMMTSRDEPVDEHMALLAGADDYIIKPIPPRLLTFRIATHLQRFDTENPLRNDMLTWGPFDIDTAQRLFLVREQAVHLTYAEFQFLHLLMTGPERVFTREQVLEEIGSHNGPGSDHILDNHASRIRKKVREHGLDDAIRTIRRVGFRMVPLRELEPG